MKKSRKALALGVTLLALGTTACAAKDTKSEQSTVRRLPGRARRRRASRQRMTSRQRRRSSSA